ncbi:hypothetical protein VTG60DRAFT_1320 [Thermothelomyces hinnuleus]
MHLASVPRYLCYIGELGKAGIGMGAEAPGWFRMSPSQLQRHGVDNITKRADFDKYHRERNLFWPDLDQV